MQLTQVQSSVQPTLAQRSMGSAQKLAAQTVSPLLSPQDDTLHFSGRQGPKPLIKLPSKQKAIARKVFKTLKFVPPGVFVISNIIAGDTRGAVLFTLVALAWRAYEGRKAGQQKSPIQAEINQQEIP